jgi:hypothetical protein
MSVLRFLRASVVFSLSNRRLFPLGQLEGDVAGLLGFIQRFAAVVDAGRPGN